MSDESLTKIEVQEPVTLEDNGFGRNRDDRQSRLWLMPLLLGTGLGVAIAFGGMGVLNHRPTGQENAIANKSAKNVPPSMTVTTATVETASVARTLSTTGTIAARDLIPVLPQTNGLQIKKIPEDIIEGTFIKKGQVLAVLDDSILQAQINQAKADVQSKEADVESNQATVASSQASVAASQAIVQQRRADLAQAQAKLEEAQKNYQRYQKLAAAGAISEQELDTRSYTVKTAIEAVRLGKENVRSAQADVSSAQANVTKAVADVNRATADVRNSTGRVGELQTQIGQTLVLAPVSGIVSEKLARVGDVTGIPPQTQVSTVIGGTQKLFSIIRDGKLELQAQVPEIQLPQVKLDASVEITSDIDNRVRLQGRVRDIQPQINDKRREATVKIDLPPTNLLKPGMFARGAITINTTIGMAVPQKAVQSQADGSVIVFTLSGEDTVRAVKVELGEPLNGNKVEIRKGLQLGQRVVVDGAAYIKDGDKVRVVSQ
ncbi:MAG: efflux RND transporter periplasmic adaptor subunit [Gloeotrichia echinulata GP01]